MGFKGAVLLPLARRWISGADLESALKDARSAGGRGMSVVINHLGEEVTDQSVADSHLDEYISLEEAIHSNGIRGCASVKLTQFGLGTDDLRAEERLEEVIRRAEELDQFLWIDMEGSAYYAKTLEVYKRVLERHRRVGVAYQSYVRSAERDLPPLLEAGAKIRLVKGAYREPAEVVFRTRDEIDRNFLRLMKTLFERSDGFVIATHDGQLVEEAKRLSESNHADFEFAMLKGVRDELKGRLLSEGYNVAEYLPYGKEWYAYSKRRITEHPSNLFLLVRSLF